MVPGRRWKRCPTAGINPAARWRKVSLGSISGRRWWRPAPLASRRADRHSTGHLDRSTGRRRADRRSTGHLDRSTGCHRADRHSTGHLGHSTVRLDRHTGRPGGHTAAADWAKRPETARSAKVLVHRNSATTDKTSARGYKAWHRGDRDIPIRRRGECPGPGPRSPGGGGGGAIACAQADRVVAIAAFLVGVVVAEEGGRLGAILREPVGRPAANACNVRGRKSSYRRPPRRRLARRPAPGSKQVAVSWEFIICCRYEGDRRVVYLLRAGPPAAYCYGAPFTTRSCALTGS